MGPFVQRDNLGGKRATIGMASRCRDEVMIAAMIVARKSFVGSDCRGASISGGFGVSRAMAAVRDRVWGFMLALDGDGHDLVEDGDAIGSRSPRVCRLFIPDCGKDA